MSPGSARLSIDRSPCGFIITIHDADGRLLYVANGGDRYIAARRQGERCLRAFERTKERPA